MRVPAGPDFDDERERFDLRYTCEDCALFDSATEQCRHGWPTEQHRRRDREPQSEVTFCKEFELC